MGVPLFVQGEFLYPLHRTGRAVGSEETVEERNAHRLTARMSRDAGEPAEQEERAE